MTICKKHGSDWIDEYYDGPGEFCLACDKIIDNQQDPENENPFHAVNQPERKQAQKEFKSEKNVILLNINFPYFKYENRQNGKIIQGSLTETQVDGFIAKAQKNAKAQKCKLFVGSGFSCVLNEDYRGYKE